MNAKAFKGLNVRVATTQSKECDSESCPWGSIDIGEEYVRVIRHDDRIEMFHRTPCFVEEFGEAAEREHANGRVQS
jgi:hypothetical protein